MPSNAVLQRRFSSFTPSLLLVVAFCLTSPLARPAEDAPAIESLRQRVESGDVEAMTVLGDAYAHGHGVAQDPVAAFRYYARAAALGHGPALFNVGVMSEKGEGTRVDAPRAFTSYLAAAELGSAPAQLKVGELLAKGFGVARDEAAAVDWYRKAAVAGIADAQYNLAFAYEHGRGVAKDQEQAQDWYGKAADRGYVRAGYNLALMLESGLGARADAVAAASLYRAAAEQGFAPAQNNYGLLLAEGRGTVPIDLVESFAWLSIAVENGASAASRDLVQKKLSNAELAAAQDRAGRIRDQIAAKGFSSVNASPPSSSVAPARSEESALIVERAPTSTIARAPLSSAENSSLKAEILALSAEVKELTRINNRFLSEQERLTAENLRLATDLRTARGLVADRVPAPAMSDEWLKERTALEEKLQDGLLKLIDAEQRIAQLQQTQETNQGVAAQLAALTAGNAELMTRIQALTYANEKMRQEHEQLAANSAKTIVDQGNAAAAEWHAERETLRAELQTLRTKLAAAEEHVVRLEQAGDLARQEAAEATGRARKIQSDLANAMMEARRANEAMVALEKQTAASAALPQQVATSDAAERQADLDAMMELRNSLAANQRHAIELGSAPNRVSEPHTSPKASFIDGTNAPFAHAAPTDNSVRQNPDAGVEPERAIEVRARSRPQRPARETIAPTTSTSEVSTKVSSRIARARAATAAAAPHRNRAITGRLRFHTVAKGDSLTAISAQYYGVASRWPEIYHANREILRGQTTIRVGQHLRVP